MPLSRLAKDVMGYSEIVFFRFAAFSFARSLLRNVRAFGGSVACLSPFAPRKNALSRSERRHPHDV